MFNIILEQSPKSKIGMLMVAQAGHGSAGDTRFVTATQSDAHRGFVFLPIVMACAMLATYALPCPNTNCMTRKRPISSTRWMKPDSTGGVCTSRFIHSLDESGRRKACQRTDSSSGWRNPDCERLGSGWIHPVSGRFGTLRGELAGELSQGVGDSVRGKFACGQIPPAGV